MVHEPNIAAWLLQGYYCWEAKHPNVWSYGHGSTTVYPTWKSFTHYSWVRTRKYILQLFQGVIIPTASLTSAEGTSPFSWFFCAVTHSQSLSITWSTTNTSPCWKLQWKKCMEKSKELLTEKVQGKGNQRLYSLKVMIVQLWSIIFVENTAFSCYPRGIATCTCM